LWKEHGQIDEWRSKKPWRILCEFYGKLAAMLIQQWLIHEQGFSQMMERAHLDYKSSLW